MIELWIALIIGVANVILLSYCARFWYRVGREYHSPSAYAMTMSCGFVISLAVVGVYSIGRELLQDQTDMATISLFMSSFTFLYAVVQLLFTRGYFSKGEVT